MSSRAERTVYKDSLVTILRRRIKLMERYLIWAEFNLTAEAKQSERYQELRLVIKGQTPGVVDWWEKADHLKGEEREDYASRICQKCKRFCFYGEICKHCG